MKARLNLSTKPLETHRRFLAAAGAIGVVAGLFFLGLGWHVYSVRRADAALREQVEKIRLDMVTLEQQRRDLEQFFNRPANAELHERSAFLNTLIDEQSLNWTQMFMDLEKILPAGVQDFLEIHEHLRPIQTLLVNQSVQKRGALMELGVGRPVKE